MGKQETLSVNARDLIGESDNLHYIDATLDKNKTTASNSATEYGLMSYLAAYTTITITNTLLRPLSGETAPLNSLPRIAGVTSPRSL